MTGRAGARELPEMDQALQPVIGYLAQATKSRTGTQPMPSQAFGLWG